MLLGVLGLQGQGNEVLQGLIGFSTGVWLGMDYGVPWWGLQEWKQALFFVELYRG